MKKQIEFLKGLAKEMKEQPTDCQAAPRFWVIKDYRWVPGNPEYDSCEMQYFYSDEDFTEFNDVKELQEYMDEYYLSDGEQLWRYIDEPKLRELVNDKDTTFEELWGFVCNNFNNFNECPVKKESYIVPDTLFLTKREALKHLEINAHHYTKDAHTYAMTAWRSPEVQQLLEIIETFDWDKVEITEVECEEES